MSIKIIYCRGGDKDAPKLAESAGMEYGIRYDYQAYGKVYMLDSGLSPRWAHYLARAKYLRPTFALTPDYMRPDKIGLDLRIMDISAIAEIVGVCPKFAGAVFDIPPDCVICESVPSKYAGWLIPDTEIIPNRNYHLLGGDPCLQLKEIKRIRKFGGIVVSADGNKLMLKATHGQVFANGRWVKHSAPTSELAQISAYEIMAYLR